MTAFEVLTPTSRPIPDATAASVELLGPDRDWRAQLDEIAVWSKGRPPRALGQDPVWPRVLEAGLDHVPYLLVARSRGRLGGILPLCRVRSRLFGDFLVSLPYLNTHGVVADEPDLAHALVDRAVALADVLGVRYLELRHEAPLAHPKLTSANVNKFHMRLALPSDEAGLWSTIRSKVRNQVRKGQGQGLSVTWGRHEYLDAFYDVLCRNMRDLGTPVFGRRLFRAILDQFPDGAELCVVRAEGRPIAAALLLHGGGVTEVPTAGALRAFRQTNCNMLMYWEMLLRAVERGQHSFDFGRSTADSSTFQFKKQWGAEPDEACWQRYVRIGSGDEVRPESGRYNRMIQAWQRLPVWLTRLIGPPVVRGIP